MSNHLRPDVRLTEIDAEVETLRSRLDEITKSEVPADDAPEAARAAYAKLPDELDAMVKRHGELVAERKTVAERAEQLEAIRNARPVVPTEPPAPVGAPSARYAGVNVAGSAQVRDPFDFDERALRSGAVSASEMSSRANAGIELRAKAADMTDDAAQAVTLMLEGKRNAMSSQSRVGLARHILETGSDQYLRSFEDYMSGGSQRAAMTLTPANGGFLVPFTLDPTIILTNAGSANPFRSLATVRSTTTNDWNGVTSAGVNAQWLAETAVAADASPTFGQLKITPAKAAAYLFGSVEVLEDAPLQSQLPGLLADAKDRIEESAFATGTGSGQPFGVVTRAATVASAAANAYSVVDVYATQQALSARFRVSGSRPAWLSSQRVINVTRGFDTAGGSSFWANLGAGTPEQLLGAPIFESTTVSSTTTTGSKPLVFGDFSQYIIVDRIGMSVMYDPMLKDAATGRPNGTSGWFAFWRTGGDVATANAFRALTIA